MGVTVSAARHCQGSPTEKALSCRALSLFVHSHTGYKCVFVVRLAGKLLCLKYGKKMIELVLGDSENMIGFNLMSFRKA